jgi:acid phosphatase
MRMSARCWNRRHVLALGAASLASPLLAGRALAQQDAMSFLAVGDWGATAAGADARAVAGQMEHVASDTAVQFVISTGDNFYNDGVSSADDPLWSEAFENVYTGPGLDVPWFPVLGNHDHHSNPDAEIAYSLRSARWTMPARYYARHVPMGDSAAIDVFFLDTEPLDQLNWASQWTADGARAQDQFNWLETELAASSAPWRVVVGHHPVFSSGHHGNSQVLVERLKPMLEAHGVQAYINGHDHDLEHIQVGPVHYLTSGAGALVRSVDTIQPGSLFARSSLGFLSASIDRDTMAIRFIDASGAELHQAHIAPEGSLRT